MTPPPTARVAGRAREDAPVVEVEALHPNFVVVVVEASQMMTLLKMMMKKEKKKQQ